MAKFETIWKQPSAFVSGAIKSFPKNFIWHGTKFISHTIVGGDNSYWKSCFEAC